MSTLQRIGERVTDARVARGMTQEGLAEVAEVAVGTIRNIERGHKVRASSMAKVMAALDLEPEAEHAWRTGLPVDVEMATEVVAMILLDMDEGDRPAALHRAVRELSKPPDSAS